MEDNSITSSFSRVNHLIRVIEDTQSCSLSVILLTTFYVLAWHFWTHVLYGILVILYSSLTLTHSPTHVNKRNRHGNQLWKDFPFAFHRSNLANSGFYIASIINLIIHNMEKSSAIGPLVHTCLINKACIIGREEGGRERLFGFCSLVPLTALLT